MLEMRLGSLSFILSILLGASAFAQAGVRDSADIVSVQVIALATEVAPGSDFPVAIVLEIKPGWHIWTDDRPVPDGIAKFDGAVFTSIRLASDWSILRAAGRADSKWIDEAPMGSSEEVLAQWPDYHEVRADVGDGPQKYPVFEGMTSIFVPLSVASSASAGTLTVTFTIEFQACTATNCVAPVTVEIPLTLQVKAGATTGAAPPGFAQFDSSIFSMIHGGVAPTTLVQFDFFDLRFSIDPNGGGFFLLLAIAGLGGLLLNLTPCVLPVIPLKIMGLSRSAGNRGRCFALGCALSFGVIAFWVVLGLAVALVSGFTSSSQLFHYPIFTLTVGIIIAIMAVGMCGFFSIPLPQSIAGVEFRHGTIAGSIGFGVMTAVLSTPCTAPLMGAAAAWAATQTPWIVLVVFGVIGSGMALPYFILSAFPQLVSHVPKSGPASDLVKQTMGLLLLAAAAYFAGAGLAGFLAAPPIPPTNDYWWVVSAFGTSAGLWLIWRTLRLTRRFKLRAVFCGLGAAIAIISAGIGIRLTDDGVIDWVYYTPARLDEALKSGDAVLIDFTAEWCLNCKTLEKTVLESSGVTELLAAGAIKAVKVDLTGNNEHGRTLLKKFDRVTIPLLVILAPDGHEVFKSDAYTPSQVIHAIKEATSSTDAQSVAPPHRPN